MKSRHTHSNLERNKQLRLFPAYAVLILWAVFFTALVGWIVLASLSTTPEIFSNELLKSGLHFENYLRVMEKQKLSLYFFNSLLYSTLGSIGIILIAAPSAYVLGRKRFKGRPLINSSFVIAMSIPTVMLILPLFKMATVLSLTGSRVLLIILYICLNVPFAVFFLSGFFAGLPTALEEAAAVDGCTPAKTFWRIMFPLARSGLITLTIFNFINIWNEYFIALIFGNKADMRTVSTGLQAIVQSMRYSGDWAGLFAGVVVVSLPTVVLYVFLSDKIIAGVTSGSVKE